MTTDGEVDVDTLVEHHRRLVDEHGVSVVHVRGDEVGPALTHTVGLSLRPEQPELVVSGLEMAVSFPLLGLATQTVLDGRRLQAGDELHDIGPVPVRLEPVSHPELMVVLQAMYAADGPPVPLLQLVWQDDAGQWPWELDREVCCRPRYVEQL